MDSLYERIGGENAILAAATIFYDKVLADPRVSHFFAGLDMDQQVRKQVAFMSWAFGGPTRYQFKPLGQAHSNLRAKGLSEAHFDAVAHHLGSTLHDLGVPPDLVDEALGIVASTRDQVLGR